MQTIQIEQIEKTIFTLKYAIHNTTSFFEAIYHDGEIEEINEWAQKISFYDGGLMFKNELRVNYLQLSNEQLLKYHDFINKQLYEIVPYITIQAMAILAALEQDETLTDEEKVKDDNFLFDDLLPPPNMPPFQDKHEAKLFLITCLSNCINSWNRLLDTLNEEVAFEFNYKKGVKPVLKPQVTSAVLDEVQESDYYKPIWNGTPGEFGAIFEALIKNGYIKQTGDLKNTVRLLQSAFTIEDKTGKPVQFTHLYKCFGEKKKEYFPHEFKLPASDNFGKK